MNGEQGGALLGLTKDQWKRSCPDLTEENELVLQAWKFCGHKWNPAAFDLAAAYLGIQDVDYMITQMGYVRDRIEQHREARLKAMKK